MAAADIRILAPIPGRSAIGVEVPNRHRHLVTLGDILTSPEARRPPTRSRSAIGMRHRGQAVLLNLATMPHVLIAGATGAGKSCGINALVTSLLMRTTPDQVRLILIDPKRVELGQYNDCPTCSPGVTNPKKAANALQWVVQGDGPPLRPAGRSRGARHRRLLRHVRRASCRRPRPGHRQRPYERLPFIVVVVDELNDLMMVAARDVEETIIRIAQMARAVGIHLVIATQRPSVDVITGVIKANIPSRMAFSVSQPPTAGSSSTRPEPRSWWAWAT